jgi:gluconolactonase
LRWPLPAPLISKSKTKRKFKKMFPAGAKVQRLATGLQFVEGPQWLPGGFLVFSDIPADELKRWDAKGGVQTFRKPSQKANGNTLDREGRLLSAEHGGRRVSRTEKDGSVSRLWMPSRGRS